jgi:hypothetical protein
MADHWLYTPDGKPAFYQREKYLYSADSDECILWEQGGWYYEMQGGKAAYWRSGKWLYAADGGHAAFYYSD